MGFPGKGFSSASWSAYRKTAEAMTCVASAGSRYVGAIVKFEPSASCPSIGRSAIATAAAPVIAIATMSHINAYRGTPDSSGRPLSTPFHSIPFAFSGTVGDPAGARKEEHGTVVPEADAAGVEGPDDVLTPALTPIAEVQR